ncbi:MAG TPA: hypothetical protein VE338_04565 [Ktedonobacterales bacterium]|jgi:hypothetical protein|nr:hypothetical protein [Ktedonobacterales bacterium]
MSRSGVEDKPTWRSLPPEVRRRVAGELGAEVARAARIWGGYGPSPTFRLTLANGQRAFFKGCGPGASAFLHDVMQTEERVYTELERYISPWAPRLLGAIHEGGWHALLLEDVGPKTAPPWSPTLAQRVMRAYAGFHQASLGADLPAWLPRFADDEARVTWRSVIEQTDDLREVANLAGSHADDALRWLRQAESLFTRLTADAAEIPGPSALLHFDTRSDNLRLQNGRLRLFDWPAVEVGPVEIDVVALAQSITVEGGPEPERLITWYGGELRPEVVDVALAWLTGFFALRAWQPEIPGLPRLRRFQRQQLATLLDWSARRFALPTPNWTAAL